MKVLFIAPVPPPVNGQSKASKVLLDGLINCKIDVTVINTNKENLKSGFDSFGRVWDVLKLLLDIWKHRNNHDVIYISLAESFLGNLRDIFIYIICFKHISKVHVHMLGGFGMNYILTKTWILSVINAFFIKRFAGVIVEGEVNYKLFSHFIDSNKVHIIPNFAEDYLFAETKEISSKFSNLDPLQILYLSNLLPGKGYLELVKAFLDLPLDLKCNFKLVFVGGFESLKDQNDFLSLISHDQRISYLGKFIDGEEKRNLYNSSHLFCLPTYYPYEGQPISIIEAYSMGCVVISTNHSGIPQVFSEENGFLVEIKSVESIKNLLSNFMFHLDKLEIIAIKNRDLAQSKFRTSIFQNDIIQVFLKNSINKPLFHA